MVSPDDKRTPEERYMPADTAADLHARVTESEKQTAALAGQVGQIATLLSDIGDQLNLNRGATERGFRELRHEIRTEIEAVRQPKGQWVSLLAALVALVGLVGGPFLVYSSNANERTTKLESRQYAQAIDQAMTNGAEAERRSWLLRELDKINARSENLSRQRIDGEPERWRRQDAMAERDAIQAQIDHLHTMSCPSTQGEAP